MKRFAATVAFAAILALTAFSFSGVGAAQAHDGGHNGGCRGFGEGVVASTLAQNDFGQFLQDFAPDSPPGAVSDMVDDVGHSFCG